MKRDRGANNFKRERDERKMKASENITPQRENNYPYTDVWRNILRLA